MKKSQPGAFTELCLIEAANQIMYSGPDRPCLILTQRGPEVAWLSTWTTEKTFGVWMVRGG